MASALDPTLEGWASAMAPGHSPVSSELLTWLVGNLSAFCFKKARVFLLLLIRNTPPTY